MRLFVAVEISDEMRRVAARTAETIRRKLGQRIEARWVDPQKMHLTVRFLGHVVDDRVPALLKILAEPLSIAPFVISLGGCGVFPSSGGIRVVWIGLRTGLPSLIAMHDEYNQRLAPFGFEPETRPYSAHLTLARVHGRCASGKRDIIEHVAVDAPASEVHRATIFRSHMSSAGSWYEPLGHADLGHGTHG